MISSGTAYPYKLKAVIRKLESMLAVKRSMEAILIHMPLRRKLLSVRPMDIIETANT